MRPVEERFYRSFGWHQINLSKALDTLPNFWCDFQAFPLIVDPGFYGAETIDPLVLFLRRICAKSDEPFALVRESASSTETIS